MKYRGNHMKYFLSFSLCTLAVYLFNPAKAQANFSSLQCDTVAVLDLTSDEPNAYEVQALIKIERISPPEDVPASVKVTGIPGINNELYMNFQDIFGLGSQPDGVVLFADRNSGDGTIQDICGDEYNTFIQPNNTNNLYCAVCR